MATLAQLRVSDPSGKRIFEIVVTDAHTMFNVHRVIQFCIKPRQADSLIDTKVRCREVQAVMYLNVSDKCKSALHACTELLHTSIDWLVFLLSDTPRWLSSPAQRRKRVVSATQFNVSAFAPCLTAEQCLFVTHS
jgi:hypothetical protein